MSVKSLLYIALFFCSMLSQFSQAQEEPQLRRTHTNEFDEEYYVLVKTPKKLTYDSDKNYSWYKNQKIHTSQGTSGGYLLHGSYIKYSIDHQVLERGSYEYGIKNGLWRKWNQDGKVIENSNWSNGNPNGKVELFDSLGNRISLNNYKNGSLHGLQISTVGDSINYKKGVKHGRSYSRENGQRTFGKYRKGLKQGLWVQGVDSVQYKKGEIYTKPVKEKKIRKKREDKDSDDKSKDDSLEKTKKSNKKKKTKKDKKKDEDKVKKKTRKTKRVRRQKSKEEEPNVKG